MTSKGLEYFDKGVEPFNTKYDLNIIGIIRPVLERFSQDPFHCDSLNHNLKYIYYLIKVGRFFAKINPRVFQAELILNLAAKSFITMHSEAPSHRLRCYYEIQQSRFNQG